MSGAPRVLPVGDAAVSVELGDAIDPELNARVHALDAALAADPFPGLRETLPSYRALLVVFDPRRIGFDELRGTLLERAGATPGRAPEPRRHRVPTRYDGADLADVARHCGLDAASLVRLHCEREYTALMLGFRPGFAYLGLTDPHLDVPRLATPRTRVPAGSVAVAGRQTAVYPSASPGGWRLLGRTDLRAFDPLADPPARIRPGDRVRFAPVDADPGEPAPPQTPAPEGPPVLEVVAPGLLTTVQDAGRFGLLRYGVSWAGPMDPLAAADANRALGNPADAALLECTGLGPTLRFTAAAHFAIAGADLGALLVRQDLGEWPVPARQRTLARAGNVLCFAERRAGFRAYLAVAGGIAATPVLGSRATDLGSGFGGHRGRALAAGDRLAILGRPVREPETLAHAPPPEPAVTVRVVPGPQQELFDEEALRRLYGAWFGVGPAADRTGYRLEGPPIAARRREIVTDAMLPGAIQVPPDGAPILMMADAPTSGGYPKPGVVVAADLPRLAQLAPGEGRVRFEPIDPEAARRLAAAEPHPGRS